jgi:hypothetical protein
MSATPIDPQKLQLKRKVCISTFTIGLPAYYLIKNRNNIYKASKLVREFYFKDIIANDYFWVHYWRWGIYLSLWA